MKSLEEFQDSIIKCEENIHVSYTYEFFELMENKLSVDLFLCPIVVLEQVLAI